MQAMKYNIRDEGNIPTLWMIREFYTFKRISSREQTIGHNSQRPNITFFIVIVFEDLDDEMENNIQRISRNILE